VRGVRFREEGWEGQCDQCRQWWPLDTEAWRPKHGLRVCYACNRESRRQYVAALRASNPEMRARHREASRENQQLKRAVDRDRYLEYQRRWWAKNHVRLSAEAAERHAIQQELSGHTVRRRSPREETPETLAYRRAFRAKWIALHGPIVRPVPSFQERMARQRERKREWMRAKRAEAKAA
jgi:hypothetical protein